MKETDLCVREFERLAKKVEQPAWLFPIRRSNMDCFAEHGFPQVREEDWRFTNVAPIGNLPLKLLFGNHSGDLTVELISKFTFGGLVAKRLVFVNGMFAPELS